jgi:hypothetical protein
VPCHYTAIGLSFTCIGGKNRMSNRLQSKTHTTVKEPGKYVPLCLSVNIVAGRRALGMGSLYLESRTLLRQWNRCGCTDTHKNVLSQQGNETATSISTELIIPNLNGNTNLNKSFFLLVVHVCNMNY